MVLRGSLLPVRGTLVLLVVILIMLYQVALLTSSTLCVYYNLTLELLLHHGPKVKTNMAYIGLSQHLCSASAASGCDDVLGEHRLNISRTMTSITGVPWYHTRYLVPGTLVPGTWYQAVPTWYCYQVGNS